MAFRPYVDNDGETLLSQMMVRTGRQIDQLELQFQINGWTSQMFAVKGDVSDLQPADISKFAKRRGYADTSFAVKRLCEVIRGSVSPVIERVSEGMWRLRFGPLRDVPTYEVLKNIFTEWSREFHPLYADSKKANLIRVAGQYGQFRFSSGHVIPTWRTNIVEHRVWLETNGGLGGDRWRDPLGWFVSWCAARGLNLSCHRYIGLMPSINRGNMLSAGGTGFTVIRGPVDLFGLQPVWHVPLISEFVGVLDFGFTSLSTEAPTSSVSSITYGGESISTAVKGLIGPTFRTMDITQQLAKPEDQVIAFESKDSSTRANGWTRPVPSDEIAALRVALGPFADDLVQATADGGWQPTNSPPYTGPVIRNHAFILRNWKVAVPYGLQEFIFNLSHAVHTAPAAMSIAQFSADRMYLTTKFQVLREYAERCKSEPGTTPVEKANLQKFIDKSSDKADAKIFTTVFSGEFEAPSMEMVESLEFVQKGKKADVNVLDEKQDGVTVTLRDMAKKLDRDRVKGRKHSMFSSVVDEALSIDEMFTEFVKQEVLDARMWSFSLSVSQGSDDTIYGTKGVGLPVPVDPMDAAILRAHGAASTVPERVWSAAGINDVVIADMQSAGSGQLTGRDVRPSHWSTVNSVKWDNLAPIAFCDANGYPVLAYADQDSYTRAFLMLKGPEGEPSDLLAAMFFANTLDM